MSIPVIRDAHFLLAAHSLEQLPPPAFAEIAFAGKSNVGKSSLINTLVQRNKLVRTSATPGCTRSINLFRIHTGGAVLDFVDLPGYGFAKRSKTERRAWGTLIEGFLRTRPGLRAVVVIVDVRRGIDPDTEMLREFLNEVGVATILVATKLDKLPISQQKMALVALTRSAKERVLGFSAVSKHGMDALWSAIFDAAHVQTSQPPKTTVNGQ